MFHFHCIAQHAVEMRRTHLKVTCPLDPWVWTLCTQDKGKEEEMEKEYLAMFAHMRKEAASDARACVPWACQPRSLPWQCSYRVA